jgi:hypothetical protein
MRLGDRHHPQCLSPYLAQAILREEGSSIGRGWVRYVNRWATQEHGLWLTCSPLMPASYACPSVFVLSTEAYLDMCFCVFTLRSSLGTNTLLRTPVRATRLLLEISFAYRIVHCVLNHLVKVRGTSTTRPPNYYSSS